MYFQYSLHYSNKYVKFLGFFLWTSDRTNVGKPCMVAFDNLK